MTTEKTTASATATTTTAPKAEAKVFPNSDISKYPQYKAAVENELADGTLGYLVAQGYNSFFSLLELNGDAIPELVTSVTYGEYTSNPTISSIFAISDGEAVKLQTTGGTGHDGIVIYPDGMILHSGSGGASMGGGACYIYEGGSQLTEQYSYSYEYKQDGTVKYTYTKNGETKELSENDFKNVTQFGDPLKLDSAPLSDMGITVKAESKETYLYNGIVATESGSLNLRETPDANGSIITQLPKGTKGSVYSIEGNSDWYKFYPDNSSSSGYVAAQYIKEFTGSTVTGTSTPYGTFTYTNYNSNNYNRSCIKIVSPESIGVSVDCDLESFNAKHSDYKLDGCYYIITKNDYDNKPHNYILHLVLTGTMLTDEELYFEPGIYIRNNKTGEESHYVDCFDSNSKITLYLGETFCFDELSEVGTLGHTINDNTSYTTFCK